MATQTQTRTLISSMQLARPRGKLAYRVTLTVFILGFALVFLFPLYWMVTNGIKSTGEVIQSPPSFWPHSFNFSNFTAAWSDLDLGHLMTNTLYYALGALAFQLVFDVSAAYALSKLRPVLGNIVLFAMLTTLMIPATVLAVPAFLIALDMPLLHINLTNSPWAIWLPSVANGFSIFLLKRFFDAVPEELIQAAAIDGAGPLRTMWSVVLPIARPVLGVISIFAVVNVWKDFLWPLLVLDQAHATVNTGLIQLQSGTPPEITYAALVIASLPTIIFFLIFQRNILAGLGAGAIKD
ncbi:MAG: multiple sugar transport system permease protein [Frankiales bacterium]|jgi:multiple sugar transport system permease protein|nr:multiple sugar transport system permease protein [Frankiales bacterium]